MVKSRKEANEECAALAVSYAEDSVGRDNAVSLRRIACALELLYENGIEVRGEITAWKGEV